MVADLWGEEVAKTMNFKIKPPAQMKMKNPAPMK